jgi:cyclic pyranopterin phosphate synthase
MPEREYVWLPRQDILHFEEIDVLVRIFTTLGVDRVRLTGGEPLLRRDLRQLVGMLARQPALRDIAMTTNGLLLAEEAQALRSAGLHRVTVSLDSLRPDRFRMLARRDGLEKVLDGIAAVRAAGFHDTKIDTVALRGINDDEICDLIEFGKEAGAEVRFIEYMDVGGATRWTMGQVLPRVEILGTIAQRYGAIEPVEEPATAPAQRFTLRDGTIFGIVASTTAPFCAACDRSRLTADGLWLLCLYAASGIDLRGPLRDGTPHVEIAARIGAAWSTRRDRGAEERLAALGRSVSVPSTALKRDPHLEMHTRGG